MRCLCSLLLLLCLSHAGIAQESGTAEPTITVRSTLVMAPVFVNTKEGQPVFDLKVDDFLLTDNGVPQFLTLEREARNGLGTTSAQSLAQLTGGEFHRFHSAKDLKAGLIALSNDIPNYYVLSFRPVNPTLGLHALRVTTKDHGQFVTKFRREYWVDDAKQ